MKLEKHWKFSRHFAERFVERVCAGRHDQVLKRVVGEFEKSCLQKVFECIVYGTAQRTLVEGYFVCYRWDETLRKLIVTTIYKKGSRNVDY